MSSTNKNFRHGDGAALRARDVHIEMKCGKSWLHQHLRKTSKTHTEPQAMVLTLQDPLTRGAAVVAISHSHAKRGDLNSIVPLILSGGGTTTAAVSGGNFSTASMRTKLTPTKGSSFESSLFRVPYEIFEQLHQEAQTSGFFLPPKVPGDGKKGTYSQPLTLKLLAGWSSLACYWAFLGVKNTSRKFIQKWLTFTSATTYYSWVKPPTEANALKYANMYPATASAPVRIVLSMFMGNLASLEPAAALMAFMYIGIHALLAKQPYILAKKNSLPAASILRLG
eukprot:1063507-Pleurochrysis_carterae.AAC.1